MAVKKSVVPAQSKPPTAKPDPETFNEVVARATVRDIRLVGSRLDFKPEVVEAAGPDLDFDLNDQLESWSCDNERGILSGVHAYTASIVVGRKKLLSVQCRYLTTFRLSDLCDEEAGRHFLMRVARLAAYPYFRATFATLTQQSGISLPPLPVLSDGPRWVRPPQRPVESLRDAPTLAAPSSSAIPSPKEQGRGSSLPDETRRRSMADDKSKRGGADRSQVGGGEGYEVSYFARKHGISRDQAEALIKRVGNDRDKLNAAAAKLK